jgi:sugar transferase (PEP-CTERM system associated)
VRNAIFVVGEGLIIFISVIIASCIMRGMDVLAIEIWIPMKAFLITVVCQVCLYYNDLYDLNITDTFFELGIRLLQALGAAAILLAILYFIFPTCIIGRGIFITSVGFSILFIVTWRFGYSHVLNRGLFDQKIILLGAGGLAVDIINQILEKKDCGYTIAAIITKKKEFANDQDKLPARLYRQNFEGIHKDAENLGVKKIVVALEERRGNFPVQELLRCRTAGLEVLEGNSFIEQLTGKLIVRKINPSWLIFSEGFQKPWGRRIFKRVCDLLLSTLMLILLSPVLLIVAILIKLDSPGPVIFSQERVGEKRKPYMVHKFRSMHEDAEKHSGPVWAQTGDERITRVGQFIRKWRIDEIPQLWNVLKGEMSFVGPRPEREHFVKELVKEIPYYAERFTVKPGVTGWAQVSYGYGATVEDAVEKLNYELFYIKNMTVFMDLMVIMRTVKTVIFGKGAR